MSGEEMSKYNNMGGGGGRGISIYNNIGGGGSTKFVNLKLVDIVWLFSKHVLKYAMLYFSGRVIPVDYYCKLL